jgi:adenylate cyclase
MGVEIERKFRVEGTGWRALATSSRRLRQAYLCNDERVAVRVRVEEGTRASLTVKTAGSSRQREEYEYDIPVADAERLFALRVGNMVEKVRHAVVDRGLGWEIDVFSGENEGLVIAEVELPDPEQAIEKPSWLGEEVTSDLRFYNSSLARRPYRTW